MTKDEALDLALEALENSVDLVREDAYNAEKLYGNYPTRQGKVRGLKALADDHEKAITAIKQARALDKKAENARELGLDYEPVQDSTCNETLRAQGKAYPRTCRKCGLGPCIGAPKPPPAQPAPVQECLVHGECFGGKCIYTTPPAAQRQWVGLTDEEMYLNCPNWLSQEQCKVWVQQIEAKLKEKNAAAQPAVQEPVATVQCINGVTIGYLDVMQPVGTKLYTTLPVAPIPDAIHHTDLSEHPQYIEGWNDCRQAMLEMMK